MTREESDENQRGVRSAAAGASASFVATFVSSAFPFLLGARSSRIVIFEPGRGRGVCLYDRDQFFNQSIGQKSHQRLGTNIVNWLSGKTR